MSNYTEDDLVRWAALDGQYVDEKILARAKEVVAEIKAAVWDEGYEAAAKYHSLDTEHSEPNPYRTVKDN